MAKFTFFRDTKMTIWQRETFIIEADNKEEAAEQAKSFIDENPIDDPQFQDCILIDESAEAMSPADNDGAATLEIIDKETNTCIASNGDCSSFIEQQNINL